MRVKSRINDFALTFITRGIKMAKTMKSILTLSVFFSILLLSSAVLSENRIIYTDKSMDFYGYCEELKVGDVITAYDPDGILCGEFTVTKDGQYGIMHVYGDDVFSDNVDEGAVSGDIITFHINGMAAFPVNTYRQIWTKDGDSIRLDF